MNRRERRSAEAKTRKAVKVGDVIFTRTFFTMTEGKRAYWWVKITEHMTDEEALQQEKHGPFRSEQEAKANERLVLLGPQCEVTEAGVWDPNWSKPQ